jgi:uncharacterized membrane protein YbaN (DUF454 family)
MHLRAIWFAVGAVSTGFGLAGAILPLVPTTPFVLVAAYAFARSSPRLEAWLLNHARFGRLIRNWRQHRGVEPHVKVAAVCVMAATFMMSWILGLSPTLLAIQGAALAAAAIFVLTRPSVPEA